MPDTSATLKIVQSPTIEDANLPVPVHFNGIDQPVLSNYVQAVPGGSSNVISPIITLTGTTPNLNCQGNTRIFEIVLTGNTTYTISNVIKGQIFIIRVQQGTGTAYTNTWFAAVTWITAGAVAPVETTVSNGITTYGFVCRGGAIFDGY